VPEPRCFYRNAERFSGIENPAQIKIFDSRTKRKYCFLVEAIVPCNSNCKTCEDDLKKPSEYFIVKKKKGTG
jgi:hypothetical protein